MCVQVCFEVHILHITYMLSIVWTVSVCVCVQSDAEWGGAGWVPLCDGAPTERLLHSVLHWNLRQPPDQLPPPLHAHQVLHNIQLDACYVFPRTRCITYMYILQRYGKAPEILFCKITLTLGLVGEQE